MAQMGMAAARLCVRAKSEVMVAHSQQPTAMTVLRAMKWPAAVGGVCVCVCSLAGTTVVVALAQARTPGCSPKLPNSNWPRRVCSGSPENPPNTLEGGTHTAPRD